MGESGGDGDDGAVGHGGGGDGSFGHLHMSIWGADRGILIKGSEFTFKSHECSFLMHIVIILSSSPMTFDTPKTNTTLEGKFGTLN